jgi:hypothetical protein
MVLQDFWWSALVVCRVEVVCLGSLGCRNMALVPVLVLVLESGGGKYSYYKNFSLWKLMNSSCMLHEIMLTVFTMTTFRN